MAGWVISSSAELGLTPAEDGVRDGGLEKVLHQRTVGLEQAAQSSVTALSAEVQGVSDNAFRHRVWV